MPVTDKPLEELKTYMGSSPCPDDMDRFWDEALAEMHAIDPQVELVPAEFSAPNAECFHLYFTGVGGARVHAKYVRPLNVAEADHPAVVEFHGYSASSGDWLGKLPWALAGYSIASLDCRGQGGLSEDTGKVKGNTLHGHIIRGLADSPDKLLFRQIFLDTAQLARIVMSFDEVDATRVGAFGGSQGGGLTLACAALEPAINRAAPMYPFLCDYKRVWEMDLDQRAYVELRDFFRRFDPTHANEDETFTKLGYIDVQNLAKRIRGSFPQIAGADYVPEGRDRLGFRWWRGYNFHTDYFNGTVNTDGEWMVERWGEEEYETDALNPYAFEFLDEARDPDKPFCLMVNPHQPHITSGKFAPEAYYDRLPDDLGLPPNWNGQDSEKDLQAYRHYLAMILAVDDMLGELRAGLEERGLIDNTIFVFTTDHGTHLGTHGDTFWGKKMPWEENVKVPFIIHWPGVFEGGRRCDTLTAPVDLLPTFCGLCDIPIPRTVEGHDLSAAWRDEPGAFEQDAVLMMNFLKYYDRVMDGWEWRGVRTKTHTYARFLDGTELLFDNVADPGQANNLIEAEPELSEQLETRMNELLATRGDRLQPASAYADWFDNQRRVVANAYGPLPHPDQEPDWSLL